MTLEEAIERLRDEIGCWPPESGYAHTIRRECENVLKAYDAEQERKAKQAEALERLLYGVDEVSSRISFCKSCRRDSKELDRIRNNYLATLGEEE